MAEKFLRLPRLLEVGDMLDDEVDERSVIILLSQLCRKMKMVEMLNQHFTPDQVEDLMAKFDQNKLMTLPQVVQFGKTLPRVCFPFRFPIFESIFDR